MSGSVRERGSALVVESQRGDGDRARRNGRIVTIAKPNMGSCDFGGVAQKG